MALKPDEVQKIAELARLELSPEEVIRYGTQLSGILDYVACLNELDVSKIEPTAHAVSVPTPFRCDEVATSGVERDEILKSAPDGEGPFFRVPKVI